jgi:hypothetical protein
MQLAVGALGRALAVVEAMNDQRSELRLTPRRRFRLTCPKVLSGLENGDVESSPQPRFSAD